MNHIRVTGCGEYILTKPKNNIYDLSLIHI